MSVYSNTAVSLSQNYYLRSYYKKDQNACKVSMRSEYSKTQLSYEDGRALRRAAKNLKSFSYSSEENGTDICNSILAYVDTYNNTIGSAHKSGDENISRYSRQLKKLAKEHSDDLSSIGITINSDGTMKANSNILGKATIDKVKKVFEKSSGLTNATEQYAKKVEFKSYDNLYSQMTGNGQNVDLTL